MDSNKKHDKNQSNEVLLIICPMWDPSWPPLGISYVASSLQQKGIDTDILDINIGTYCDSNKSRKNLWKMENYYLWTREGMFEETTKLFENDIENYVTKIINSDYKVIGFSLYDANILFSIKVVTILKQRKPELYIIFGGSSCYLLHDHPDMPLRYLVSQGSDMPLVESGIVDAFVVGEGEETMYDLISSYLNGKVSPINGTVLYSNKKYILSPPRSQIKNLDNVAFPAWEKLPLSKYNFKNNLPILFSRGCINKCSFCIDWRIWKGKYRCRSAKNIFEEIKTNVEEYGTNTFQCNDLLFNGNLIVLEELADLIISSGLEISWSGQGTIRKDMDTALLEKLKKSGLHNFAFGVESLSDKILKDMNKMFSFDDTIEVLKKTKETGIVTRINLILGFPTETEEDFNITKERLGEIKDYVDILACSQPCGIMLDSDLEKLAEKFTISYPRGKRHHWESLNGENTYEIRMKRVKELNEYARKLGLKAEFTGIYDQDEAIEKLNVVKINQKSNKPKKNSRHKKIKKVYSNKPTIFQRVKDQLYTLIR